MFKVVVEFVMSSLFVLVGIRYSSSRQAGLRDKRSASVTQTTCGVDKADWKTRRWMARMIGVEKRGTG